ncbi:MAG: hypothetical protein IJP03_05505 [Christensenellaceae bacterium]|nr:hypothetical protein [Christensenellaceae bacterium]
MNWLRNFMMGRYGGDQLGIATLMISMVLTFIPTWPTKIISILLLLVAFLRMFSRNVYRRRAENEKFLKIWYPVKNFFVRLFKGRPDAKTHKHYRCPKCKQALRVPKGKGTIIITCPKCGEKMTKRT